MLEPIITSLPDLTTPAAALTALRAIVGDVYTHTTLRIKRFVSSSQPPVLSLISEGLGELAVVGASANMTHTFRKEPPHRLLYTAA